MDKNTIVKEMKDYFANNFDELVSVVREINGYDGSLEYLEAYENDEEFFSLFYESRVSEAVRAVSYGDYNYNDEYVKFNGYGNLETLTGYEYKKRLYDSIDDIVETMIDNVGNIYLNDDLNEMVENLESWFRKLIQLSLDN